MLNKQWLYVVDIYISPGSEGLITETVLSSARIGRSVNRDYRLEKKKTHNE